MAIEHNEAKDDATHSGVKVMGRGCFVLIGLIIVWLIVVVWKEKPKTDPQKERVRAAQAEAIDSGQPVVVSLSKEEIDKLPTLKGEAELLGVKSPMTVSETELRASATKIVPLPSLPEPLPAGSVQVQILVSEQGEVVNTKILNGNADSVLGKAAMETAKQWHFKPFSQSGMTVKAIGELTLSYTNK